MTFKLTMTDHTLVFERTSHGGFTVSVDGEAPEVGGEHALNDLRRFVNAPNPNKLDKALVVQARVARTREIRVFTRDSVHQDFRMVDHGDRLTAEQVLAIYTDHKIIL